MATPTLSGPNRDPYPDALWDYTEPNFSTVVNLGDEGLQEGDDLAPFLNQNKGNGVKIVIPEGNYTLTSRNSLFDLPGGDYKVEGQGGLGGVTIEQQDIDEAPIMTVSDSDSITIFENLDILGEIPSDADYGLRARVRATDSELIWKRVRMPDGQADGTTGDQQASGLRVVTNEQAGDNGHIGSLRLLWSEISGFHDNGLYADGENNANLSQGDPYYGRVIVVGGRYENNNISQIRIGTPYSTIYGVRFFHTGSAGSAESENHRGIYIREPQEGSYELFPEYKFLCSNCHFDWQNGSNPGGPVIEVDSDLDPEAQGVMEDFYIIDDASGYTIKGLDSTWPSDTWTFDNFNIQGGDVDITSDASLTNSPQPNSSDVEDPDMTVWWGPEETTEPPTDGEQLNFSASGLGRFSSTRTVLTVGEPVPDIDGYDCYENFYSIIDQDWDDISLDNDSTYEETPNYSAVICPREPDPTSTLQSKVERISYNPEVNAVKGMTLGVEPFEELEGDEYIGGVVDVFVNGEPLFAGEIFSIETTQRKDDFYTLTLEPPAKKLRDDTVNVQTDEYIVNDFMAKTIDKYNDWADEHFAYANTGAEILNDIEEVNRTRTAQSTDASASYLNVGVASDLEVVYAKVDTIGQTTGDIVLNIKTREGTYSRDISAVNGGTFGEWTKLEFDIDEEFFYDIEFEFNREGAVLYDWIALNEQKLSRKVYPETALPLASDEVVQDADEEGSFNVILSSLLENDGFPFEVTANGIEPLRTAEVIEGEEDFITTLRARDSFSAGEATGIGSTFAEVGDQGVYNFNLDYKYQDPTLAVRKFNSPDDEADEEVILPEFEIRVDGNVVERYVDGASVPPSNEPEWEFYDLGFNPGSGSTNVTFEILSTGIDFSQEPVEDYGEFEVDLVCLFDNQFTHNFDNSVHEPQGYLDGPEPYPKTGMELELPENILSNIIDSAEFNITTNRGQIGQMGISFDSDPKTFTTQNDTESISVDNTQPTSIVTGKLVFDGYEANGPRLQTPRRGYSKEIVNSFELSVNTSTIETLFSQEFSGNRLKVLTDIADNSIAFYRWEGNDCKIFNRGRQFASLNIKTLDVDSRISIEDVYSSCEVIGQDGISSGIITADDAPDFIDRHKEIRDPSIDNEIDAERRANTFLRKNSSIEYEGNVTTLPTLAELGDQVDGSTFNHGESMYIESVRYSKDRADISLGKSKKLKDELIKLNRETSSSQETQTS